MNDDDNVRQLRPRTWDLTEHAAPGTRFVGPQEFLDGLPGTVHRSLVKTTVAEALAAGADDDGVLLNFHEPDFFSTHVVAVLNRELEVNDEEITPLVYDRFTAMALMDCLHSLMIDDGLIANRGNGDTHDYRLTLR